MKLLTLALVTLGVAGLLALDGAASSVGADGLVTGNAAASCYDDPITGGCLWLCPQVVTDRLGWECTM